MAVQPTAFPEAVSAVVGPIRTLPLAACPVCPGLGPDKPVDAPHLGQAPPRAGSQDHPQVPASRSPETPCETATGRKLYPG